MVGMINSLSYRLITQGNNENGWSLVMLNNGKSRFIMMVNTCSKWLISLINMMINSNDGYYMIDQSCTVNRHHTDRYCIIMDTAQSL